MPRCSKLNSLILSSYNEEQYNYFFIMIDLMSPFLKIRQTVQLEIFAFQKKIICQLLLYYQNASTLSQDFKLLPN